MESYPILVDIQVRVDRSGYENMGYPKPNRIHTVMENGVVDARAQVVMIDSKLATKLGVRREEVLNTNTVVEMASGKSLDVVGGIPIIISSKTDGNGEKKESRQMAYVVSGESCLVINKSAL